MEEIWKDIEGYDGTYQVSNLGRVKSINAHNTGKEYTLTLMDKKGYYQVHINYKGKSKYLGVHRLVAKAFIPNQNNYHCVNHKNENKKDNRVENLEWCTHAYNNRYGTRIQRVIEKTGQKVSIFNLDTKEREYYKSKQEIMRKYKIARNKLNRMIENHEPHRFRKYKNLVFEYYI